MIALWVINFSLLLRLKIGPIRYEVMGAFNCGIKEGQLSGYQKFEGPDPAEWCPRGYAILNIDSRGVFGSQGTSFFKFLKMWT